MPAPVDGQSSVSPDQQTASAMDDMKKTFAEAIAQNAQITKIQTQGNTAKRAASASPQ